MRDRANLRTNDEGLHLAADTRGTTRFQVIRQQYRNRPLSLIIFVSGLLAIGASYGYLIFYVSPDRSYEYVLTWKAAIQYRNGEILVEKAEAKRLRSEKREKRSSGRSDESTDTLNRPARFLTFMVTYLLCRNLLRSLLYQRRSLRDNIQSRGSSRTESESTNDYGIARELQNLGRWSQLTRRDDIEGLRFDQTRPRGEESPTSRGASIQQITSCPVRVLQAGDDVLQADEDRPSAHSQCDICLQGYGVGDAIRTIPCFHSFHASCIDEWLIQRGSCPVCMHPL